MRHPRSGLDNRAMPGDEDRRDWNAGRWRRSTAGDVRTGRREILVLRLVCNIARHRKVAGGEAHHLRCSRCGTIAGPFEGSPLWVSAIAQLAREYGETPPGFRCPGCGRDRPLSVGEVLANDTIVCCRHRWICRFSWRAPAAVAAVTCPRCGTVQPGPDARRLSAQLGQWLGE